jgi:hypothetical protein
LIHFRDYEANPALDKYDETMLDEEQYEPLTFEQRQAAESEMSQRTKKKRKVVSRAPQRRLPNAIADESSDGLLLEIFLSV